MAIITSPTDPRHLLNIKISTNNIVRANHLLDFCGSCIKNSYITKYRFIDNHIISIDDKETHDATYTVSISITDLSKVIAPIKGILNYGVHFQTPLSPYLYSYTTLYNYEKKIRAKFSNVDTIFFKDIPDLSPNSKTTFYQWKSSSFFDHLVLGSDKSQITLSFRDFAYSSSPKYSKKFGRLNLSLFPLTWSQQHFIKFPHIIKNIIIFVQESISC